MDRTNRSKQLSRNFLVALLVSGLVSGCSTQPETTLVQELNLPAIAEIPQLSLPISVTQAYQAIPHQRTEFNDTFSGIPYSDREYLVMMFSVIDQATTLRVTTLQEFTNGDRSPKRIEQYQQLINFTNTINPPASLTTYHTDIINALQAQQAFYQDWYAKGRGFSYRGSAIGNHPQVKTASAHLRSAYSKLMQGFPNENSTNRAAFFDYLCALDFI